MSERITIRREVELEDGREHLWWTVVDRESGYNKTFRSETTAMVHAEELRSRG